MAVTAMGVAKLAVFVKNNWKPILVVIISGIMIILLLPIIIFGAIFPSAEPSLLNIYKTTAMEAKIDVKELITYDTVRYKNELENISQTDVVKSALEFYEVILRRYEEVEKEIKTIDEKTGKEIINTEYEWEFRSETRYTGSAQILSMFREIGYNTLYSNFNSLLRAFSDIESTEEYDISYEQLAFSYLIQEFNEEEKEWVQELLNSDLEELFEQK